MKRSEQRPVETIKCANIHIVGLRAEEKHKGAQEVPKEVMARQCSHTDFSVRLIMCSYQTPGRPEDKSLSTKQVYPEKLFFTNGENKIFSSKQKLDKCVTSRIGHMLGQ